MSSVAPVRRSVKSGAHGRRWPTQAQLMRSEIFETSMSWAGSVSGVLCRCLREEGELACLCLVSVLVIQPVLLCNVLRRFVHATGCGKHLCNFVYRVESSIRKFVLARSTPLL